MAGVSQHTVSRFYLKQFTATNGDRILWQYDKETQRLARKSPASATAEDHFYSVQRADGTWDDSIDDALQVGETRAAPAVRKLAAGNEIPLGERDVVGAFIGLMLLRVQGLSEHADAVRGGLLTVEETVRYVERNRAQFVGRSSDAKVDEFLSEVKSRGYGVTVPRNFHLEGLLQRAARFAHDIKIMHWTVYFAARGSFFVTSDNPAFVRRPEFPMDPYLVGIERDDLGAELGFPLSRSSFLIASWNSGTGFSIEKASKTRTHELNRRTLLSANRHIFSPEKSEAIFDLVREHAGFRLKYPTLPS
jgi:hypothetical protein